MCFYAFHVHFFQKSFFQKEWFPTQSSGRVLFIICFNASQHAVYEFLPNANSDESFGALNMKPSLHKAPLLR